MTGASNAAFDLAALREIQEREAIIASASATLNRVGTIECVDCGAAIPAARIAAAPFAIRCITCQKSHEDEK